MFVSHENNCKKNFLKPNILRKKSKTAIRANVQGPCIPSDSQSAVTLATQETSDSILTDSFTGYNYDVPLEMPRTPIPLKLDTLLYDNVTTKLPDIKLEMEGNVSENNLSMSNYEDDHNQAVNVESFFNNGVTEAENVLMFNINPDKELRTLVVIDDESHVNSMYSEQNQDVLRNMVPLSSVSSIKHDPAQDMQPEASTTTPDQDLFQQLIATPVKFKCEAPNCNKEFRSEQKLKKHENIHKKDSGSAPRQITVECPVKKVLPDGTEQPCGKIYLVREQLVRHLNEDHTLEDASYRCSECGRQFFWASGLRAHARAHAVPRPPAALVCAWAGCGRQFRQPCRLREHARAHTGDRPYACPYPDCDWSFRSASKLERHARRHTGERRHECSACGRAFLRRDHLREHAARRHAHAAHRCTHAGCKHVFSNTSSLYLHMKKVHRNQESEKTTPENADDPSLLKNNWDFIFLTVEGVEEPEASEGKALETEVESKPEPEMEAEVEAGRAARTHCPWPLQSRALHQYVMEEEGANVAQSVVEPSENSESNIYTVRSDLFLHGNVLINEDSEHMGAVWVPGAGPEAEPESGPDDRADHALGELGLLDAHPTIDLMQEELMYTVWQ